MCYMYKITSIPWFVNGISVIRNFLNVYRYTATNGISFKTDFRYNITKTSPDYRYTGKPLITRLYRYIVQV